MKFCYFFLFSCFFCYADLPSYSLRDGRKHPIDHKLVTLLDKKGGFFIEVGALDGITQSNTKLLEDFFGWQGILIEPSPNAFKKLCENRPQCYLFNCALGSFEQNGTSLTGDFLGDPMSSVEGKRKDAQELIEVPVRSLQSILDELSITHVDFFSLDTEGYEYTILQGIDFSRVTFDYLMIEIYKWDFEKIVKFMEKRGYSLHSCISKYGRGNKRWDKTHNDYLFKRMSAESVQKSSEKR